MKLTTVFMGSPAFAVPSLETLFKYTKLLAVICQPDKPAGRGLEPKSPAIKEAAQQLHIPVFQPVSIRPNKSDFIHILKQLNPDLIVVVAYGKILPKEILETPRLGCWNIHGSILPKYRGAAPIQWSLIQGESHTGVSLMKMDEGMDTGPVYFSKQIEISPNDTASTLSEKLSLTGAQILEKGLQECIEGSLNPPTPQNHALATMAPLLTKEHGRIDFMRSASLVSGQMRGVDPWPGAYTFLPSQPEVPLKLFGVNIVEGHGTPGEVLGIDENGLVIACGQHAVSIAELQAPGRKRLSCRAFLAGFAIPKGTILGTLP